MGRAYVAVALSVPAVLKNHSTTSDLECLGPFLDVAYGPKPPTYSCVEISCQSALPRLTEVISQILKLDRTMRDYPLPEVPAIDDVPLSNEMRVIVMLMRSFSTGGLREIGGRPLYDLPVLHAHDFGSQQLSSIFIARISSKPSCAGQKTH